MSIWAVDFDELTKLSNESSLLSPLPGGKEFQALPTAGLGCSETSWRGAETKEHSRQRRCTGWKEGTDTDTETCTDISGL